MHKIVHSDPEILGGVPVFVGTRVPVRALWDYLERNHDVNEFLADFPSVQREQVMELIRMAREQTGHHASAA